MDLSLLINSTLAQSTPTLAMTWSPIVTNLLVGVFLLVSGAMILLVLIQRPQGGGLSGAFGAGGGGGGAGQTAFGTKTGDVLTMATITIFVLFLITAIVLNFATRPQIPPAGLPTLTAPNSMGTTPVDGADDGSAVDESVDETTDDGAADGDSENGEIADPEQLIDDAMSSTPTIETGDEPTTDPAEDPADNPTPDN